MNIYNKIELYKNRTFSDLWNETFSIIKSNFKQIILLFIIFVLPINILLTILSTGFTQILTSYYMEGFEEYNARYYSSLDSYHQIISTYFSSIIFSFIQLSWTSLVMFSFFNLYTKTENTKELKLGDFFEEIKNNLLKHLLITAFLFIIIFIISGSLYVLAFKKEYVALGLIIFLLLLIYIYFYGAFYMIYPSYLLEDIDIIQAISNAIKINMKYWVTIFSFLFILSLVITIINKIFTVPTLLTSYILPLLAIQLSSVYTYTISIINKGFLVLATTFSSIFFNVASYLLYYSFSEQSRLTHINNLIESINTDEN